MLRVSEGDGLEKTCDEPNTDEREPKSCFGRVVNFKLSFVQLGFSMKLSLYVQCRILFIILLKVILLNVVMVSVAGPKVEVNFRNRKHSTRLEMSVSVETHQLILPKSKFYPQKVL